MSDHKSYDESYLAELAKQKAKERYSDEAVVTQLYVRCHICDEIVRSLCEDTNHCEYYPYE